MTDKKKTIQEALAEVQRNKENMLNEATPSKPVKTVQTKGGAYPVYGKSSPEAKDFRSSFAAARKEQGAGGKFTWQGRSYSTNTADDKPGTKPKKFDSAKPSSVGYEAPKGSTMSAGGSYKMPADQAGGPTASGKFGLKGPEGSSETAPTRTVPRPSAPAPTPSRDNNNITGLPTASGRFGIGGPTGGSSAPEPRSIPASPGSSENNPEDENNSQVSTNPSSRRKDDSRYAGIISASYENSNFSMIEAFLKLHNKPSNNLFNEAKKHKKLDPVGKEDDDIDNDGDSDESDKYLHNRRKAISKAVKEETTGLERLKAKVGLGPKSSVDPSYKPEEKSKEDRAEMDKKVKEVQKEEVEFSEAELTHFASILEMPVAPTPADYSGSNNGPSKRDLSDETIVETKKKDPSELKTRGRKAGVKIGAYKMKGMDDVAGDEAKAEPKNLVAQNPRTRNQNGKNVVDVEHPSQAGVKRTIPAKDYDSFRSGYLNAEKPEHKTKMHDAFVKKVFN
jgi:hypothetical protein